jgi:hypothetical protein
LAVSTGAVAIPLLFVTAVAVVRPLKLALAPLPGVVNVTVTPDTGLLPASRTVACSPVPNAVFTAVLCGVPAVAVTLAGALDVLVRLKLAGVGMPDTAAVTV